MSSSTDLRNPILWRHAKARAGFKVHFMIYGLVVSLLWAIWAPTTPGGFPWPLWTTFGWGIGVFFNYLGAYQVFRGSIFSPEREYERLAARTEGVDSGR